MANREKYQAWGVEGQIEHTLSLAEELKNAYKHDVSMPVNSRDDFAKGFADSHLFWVDDDLYYSDLLEYEDSYVPQFLVEDERAPYRGNYKRTEVGIMFPSLLTDEDRAKPGDTLAPKKQNFVNIYQDESAPIPDWHTFNSVDWGMFEFTTQFLDADGYFRMVNAIFNAMRVGNTMIEKAIVDTILASILGIWSYPSGHALHPLFVKDDTFTPDDAYSKDARKFYLKDGEVRKRLKEIAKYVKKYYKARNSYLTNLNTHEVIGQALSRTIPKYKEKLVDRSDESKALQAVRDWFFEKKDNKYTEVGYNLRRQSLDSFASAIFETLGRLTTSDARNWCGHEFNKEVADTEGLILRSSPSNLMVIMNNQDLEDMFYVKGSNVTGAFTESTPIRSALESWAQRGVQFHPCRFIIPSMCILIDKKAFRLVQYFNKTYTHFDPTKLIESRINHMYKKIVLYRKVVCNTLELAKGQKYALPIGWGSEHLPFLRDQS